MKIQLPIVLFAVAASSASCGIHSSRVVVPPHIYEYASKSNADIMKELPQEEAFAVMRALRRFEEPTLEKGRRLDWSTLKENADNSRKLEIESVDSAGNKRAENLNPIPRVSAFKGGHYFSTMTAIAIEEGLDPTAIPALVVGYRPNFGGDDGKANFFQGMGFDLIFGGALNNIGGGGDSDLSLALGAGVTFPWSDSGALSFGAVTWRNEAENGDGDIESDTEIAAYIGISLGSFNVKPQDQ